VTGYYFCSNWAKTQFFFFSF